MIRTNSKALTIVNLILILFLSSFIIYEKFFNNEKIVYVDKEKLFDNFQMTKDLKTIGDKEFNSRKLSIDSLYTKLQSELGSQEKESLMKLLISKKEDFDYFNQTYASTEAKKIWSRIDSYIKTYSEEKNYTLIIGSDSKRDVLYAKDCVDITQELTEYINKKYEGFK